MHYPSPLRRLGVVPGLVRLIAIVLEILSFVFLCLKHDPEYSWTTSYVIVSEPSVSHSWQSHSNETRFYELARLPDPRRSDRDRLLVRTGPRMVYLCPADVNRWRCHRRPRFGLLEGLVRAVVLARALVYNATPDWVGIILCPAVSHHIRVERLNVRADLPCSGSSASFYSPWLCLSISTRLIRTGY